MFTCIISCEKYKHKILLQDTSNLIGEYRYFIGNPDLREPVEQGKIVYLPCEDNYENLTKKTLMALEWSKRLDFQFLLKTDDDVSFGKGIENLIDNVKMDYFGKVVKGGYVSNWHRGKCDSEELNNKSFSVPNINYCVGGGYFLSKKAVNLIIENSHKEEVSIFEDVSIATILLSQGVTPDTILNYHNYLKWQ